MVFGDDDNELINGYEELEKNVIDQAVINNSQALVPSGGEQLSVQPTVGATGTKFSIGEKYRSALTAAQSPEEFDTLVELFKAELNAKQSTLLNFGKAERGTPLTENTLFNSIMSDSFSVNPDLTKSFVDNGGDLAQTFTNQWQRNFGYILGPMNTAFVDATLSYEDIANGLHLKYNPNGILWRVNAAGIPHYDDYEKFIEQQRVIEGATDCTLKEIAPQVVSDSILTNVSRAVENSPSRTKEANQPITAQSNNGLITVSPEEFAKMYPKAVYNDGTISNLNWGSIKATPLGFTTLMKNPNYFYSHSTDFSQAFDYVTLTLGYGFGQVSITKDCFGRWYVSGGLTGSFLFGKLSTPVSVSIMGGYLQNVDRSDPDLLRDTLHNFIPGKSDNVAIGVLGIIGETQSGKIKAMEIGFGTPTISVNIN